MDVNVGPQEELQLKKEVLYEVIVYTTIIYSYYLFRTSLSNALRFDK